MAAKDDGCRAAPSGAREPPEPAGGNGVSFAAGGGYHVAVAGRVVTAGMER